ncbi:hypothetical protein M8818_003866 [Zalaria obscura]|uniref:Uncharacterized protein n=1 Tax=Zalaria obscura TaxID=2024903 RepID=A0ACC3SDM7_9PEZI
MGPSEPLPIPAGWPSSEVFAESVLQFVASSELLRTLCGGVHVLDFFTRKPELYSVVLPEEWRAFFRQHDVMDVLDLLMREDVENLNSTSTEQWRNGPVPPESLISYINTIRRHSLRREFSPIAHSGKREKLARHVVQGMNVKKVHEVDHFTRYVEKLTAEIAESHERPITHLVDFGSGQNYLGRALASPPFNKHIIAVESRQHNIEGARNWDIVAKLAPKPQIRRNKKEYRAQKAARQAALARGEEVSEDSSRPETPEIPGPPTPPDEPAESAEHAREECEECTPQEDKNRATLQISAEGVGTIQYVEHWIQDGNLENVIGQIVDEDAVRKNASTELKTTPDPESTPFIEGGVTLKDSLKATNPSLMVISLHSCGNLVHHGLRSLILNPAVSAVAMIGCCYNLISERLGPTTYKHPRLRSSHPRLGKTAAAFDPHGFPMSDRLCNLEHDREKGLRLNITARMMAVQAPQNWGRKDSADFFKRHFFRALLQRVFVDQGIIDAPTTRADEEEVGNLSPLGFTGGTIPIIIGSLRKSCYRDFVSYVRGAAVKLAEEPERGAVFKERLGAMSDDEIRDYEERYQERKKELSVMWSLMAFSAGVVEATIVIDRWLWLKEQEGIAEAWVEPVFDFKLSPRNLVVVGIKK